MLAHYAALAADDRQPEKRIAPGRGLVDTAARTVTVRISRSHHLVFCFRRDRAAGPCPPDRRVRIAHSFSRFADTPRQLGRIEPAVTVEHHRRGCAVLELEKGGVVPFAGGKVRVPAPGDGAHAAHRRSAQKAHDVGLVRSLAEHDARALVGIHFG